ncbi:MAG: HD domain-containing protein [Oscillospiraceae bacterium]|nr:HD domain-containing protein [Oscillospiraceae bacterium]
MEKARIYAEIKALEQCGRYRMEHMFLQHGNTTVFEHSVHVADVCLHLAHKLHLDVDEAALIRGALLHDYFLYDFHQMGRGRMLHCIRHPRKALQNARQDFALGVVEEDIILRHMFPVTPIPPVCLEAWLVCLVDKYCAAEETAETFFQRHFLRRA